MWVCGSGFLPKPVWLINLLKANISKSIHTGPCRTQFSCDFGASASPKPPKTQPLLFNATHTCSGQGKKDSEADLTAGMPFPRAGMCSPSWAQEKGDAEELWWCWGGWWCWGAVVLCCFLSRRSCTCRGESSSLQAGRAPRVFLVAAAEDKSEEQEPLGEWSLWRPRSPRPLPCDWCSRRSSGRSEFISTKLLPAVSILVWRMAAAMKLVAGTSRSIPAGLRH